MQPRSRKASSSSVEAPKCCQSSKYHSGISSALIAFFPHEEKVAFSPLVLVILQRKTEKDAGPVLTGLRF